MNQQTLELRPLSAEVLAALPASVAVPEYDRSKVSAGIAHIGVGNFHRAHEALYVDRCLHLPSHESWGICGISLGAGAEARSKADALRKQDGLYTLTEYAPDGEVRCRVIGSLVEYMLAPADPEAVLAKLADPAIRIVSLTITEGGYNFDETTGEFLLSTPDVAHDLTASTPRTVFGYIVAALKRRRDAGLKAFTVVSCDNLRQNGNTTKRAILSFAAAVDKDLAEWIAANATFPNSMVDRIAPQVSEAVKARANAGSGIEDASPVVAETFTQWVIEDKFADGRPDFPSVGVEMRHDVEAYEAVKGRMLNASHMLLSYPAVLLGYRLVHEAMVDADIVALLSTFMEKDAIPVIDGPSGLSLSGYRDLTIERFSNPAVADQLLRVAHNGAAKIPVFHTKTIQALLDKGRDVRREALLLAGFRRYLDGVDDFGAAFDVDEGKLTPEDWQIIKEGGRLGVLHISPFSSLRLYENPQFVNAFLELSSLFEVGQARQAIQQVI
ncbi:mannitol dehydrogenase family protein [Burkholderia sp. MR1-5-21]